MFTQYYRGPNTELRLKNVWSMAPSTLTLHGGEWWASSRGRFNPLHRRLRRPKARLDDMERIICPCRESKTDRPTRRQPLHSWSDSKSIWCRIKITYLKYGLITKWSSFNTCVIGSIIPETILSLAFIPKHCFTLKVSSNILITQSLSDEHREGHQV